MKTCNKCFKDKDNSEYYSSNDKLVPYCKPCYAEYQSARSEYRKKYRKNNKKKLNDKQKMYDKTYNTLNPEKRKKTEKKANIKRKEANKIWLKKSYIRKMKDDVLFKLKKNTRGLIYGAIKRYGYTKKTKTYNILCCSFEEFKTHIEKQFESWMTWDNYGLYNGTINYGWDLDHIIPLAVAKTESDVIILNHYTNLQPLCGYTNRHIKRGLT